jgi:biotin transport system substrate-specific component
MNEARLQLQKIGALEVVPNRTARRTIAVVTFAILTALGAYASVHLPFTPVPVSLQTLFVTLAGVLLGPMLGAASQIVYVLAGAMGAPVFTGGAGLPYLLGPTGGYLISFPLAAYVCGRLGTRAGWRADSWRGMLRMAAAMAIGTGIILLMGATQLALYTGAPQRAVEMGILPFLAGDAVKIVVAVLVARRAQARTLQIL